MNRKKSQFLSLCLVLIGAMLDSCMPVQRLETTKMEPSPHLVIMSAFEPELARLLSQTNVVDTYVINGRTYHVGELAGKRVVLVLSGVSMVNAAMTTQTVLDHFEIDGIIFSGIAGGVNPGLNIGDVVVPAQWGQYQEQTFARETENGWDAGGSVSEFGNYQMMFPQYLVVTQKDGKPDNEEQRFWFSVSQDMLRIAKDLADETKLSDCTQAKLCLDQEPRVVVGGNGVSGPTFVDNASYREWVWQTFRADALDMESAAVAHVAYVNNVPFIAFRSLSDLAGGGPGKNEISTFFQLAADNSAKVVIALLEKLPDTRE
ncbi:MAG TPA: 5'-methylthioadenosine/S-adenosylhomocysteine nucleosidase [Anaerolineales bacterium]|nr:5'-methylthioadenosine/S-adenosylhomocysteine nucleosidase [Anaerolineales bacterium]